MTSKDVTSFFGSIRFFLPLVFIFFIAAGSAIACPEHRSNAAYRTKSINSRTVSYMAPVVITYGGRCAENGQTRVKYVSTRGNGYNEGGTQYVAVRRSVPRTRYIAVRDDDDYVPTRKVRYVVRDDDYASRFVAVRRKPVYVERVAVRDYDPQPRMVAVHHRDIGDVSYVVTQRIPVVDDYFEPRATRVVAVRNTGCDCSRAVSYRRSFDDEVATVGPARVAYTDDEDYSTDVRHEVVKTDYIDGTEEVIYSGSNYNDSATFDLPDENTRVSTDVSYNDVDDVDFDHHNAMYNDVAYVADYDMDAACLPESVVYSSPYAVRPRTVNYGRSYYDHEFIGGDDAAYVAIDRAAPSIRYVSSLNDVDLDGSDKAVVAYGDVDEDCLGRAAARTCDEDLTFSRSDYAPVEQLNYMPVKQVDYVPAENIVYVPVDDVNLDCSCETSVNNVGDQSISYIDESAFLTNGDDADSVPDPDSTRLVVDSDGNEYLTVTDSE